MMHVQDQIAPEPDVDAHTDYSARESVEGNALHDGSQVGTVLPESVQYYTVVGT
jgi:hypothetical protein